MAFVVLSFPVPLRHLQRRSHEEDWRACAGGGVGRARGFGGGGGVGGVLCSKATRCSRRTFTFCPSGPPLNSALSLSTSTFWHASSMPPGLPLEVAMSLGRMHTTCRSAAGDRRECALVDLQPHARRSVRQPPPPRVTFRRVAVSLRGPRQSVTRSSLRMLRRVAAFCRPLRPVLVSFPRSRSPVVGVPGLCGMWRDMPFARQRRPVVGANDPCYRLSTVDCARHRGPCVRAHETRQIHSKIYSRTGRAKDV